MYVLIMYSALDLLGNKNPAFKIKDLEWMWFIEKN